MNCFLTADTVCLPQGFRLVECCVSSVVNILLAADSENHLVIFNKTLQKCSFMVLHYDSFKPGWFSRTVVTLDSGKVCLLVKFQNNVMLMFLYQTHSCYTDLSLKERKKIVASVVLVFHILWLY